MNATQLLSLNESLACSTMEGFIRSYALSLDRDGAIVGLSGGLDSAVVLKLCLNALGSSRVKAVILPERDSQSVHVKDAVNLCRHLGIDYILKKITLPLWMLGIYRLYPPPWLFPASLVKKFIAKKIEDLGPDPFMSRLEGRNRKLDKPLAFLNIKNRIRASLLLYYAELNHYLLVGTINKSEWLTGLWVKYGDGIADIMPLSGVYKTQVIKLAKYLNIPSRFIEKPPTPDLGAAIGDEQLLQINYPKLDIILSGLEHNLTLSHIAEIADVSMEEVERVQNLINKSEWLRQPPMHLNL